ncbi:NAD(P)/FAD-dependent oxidoreductase [Nocardioides sp. JQ2195]|uniref:flavin-containing monooxygenase n=1 Tax=Nocardioides sp. JQ2195 TaxID=2592334 RepID=UPI00143E9B27|nr:NAD(P)/FAD-dependent oxidoreductase [Nocardioides sp. JQ2195]QIX28671.1 NAD(P)/FAD-dependent oxidoreductase [Nocardioides sp. JQ2195]
MTTQNPPRPQPEPGAIRDIVVIGAGFAGLYAVHASRRAGRDVLCLEAGQGVGGTWYFNRYPGARCDVESIDYSYSFDDELQQEWRWTERYATQPEILAYIEHVAERFDLLRDVRLGTRVAQAHFDESEVLWRLRTDAGEDILARHLVLATGSLSIPNLPDIAGVSDFEGEVLHTAQWPEEPPTFEGKRVGVIGTGSSGIQSVPVLAEQAAHLTVFQRTANYSVPALNRPLTDADQLRIQAEYPERRRKSRGSGGGSPHVAHPRKAADCEPEERRAALERGWTTGGVLFGKTFPDQYTDIGSNDFAREFAEEKIRARVKDPAVADRLIPTGQPLGAKRICTDSGYYETFNRDNVELVDLRTEPITTFTGWGIKTAASSYELDVVVFATGFDALTGALSRIDLRGTGGVRIQDAWKDGPHTYLGIQVPGFPNMYLVNGAGSPGVLANMVMHAELQFDWILAMIEEATARGADQIEARADAADKWTAHVDEAAAGTVFVRADSWYLGSNIEGKPRKFMLYTGGMGAYLGICAEVAENGYEGFVLTSRS